MIRYERIFGLIIPIILFVIAGCGQKAIDTLYTNPDAIVDRLNADKASREAKNFDFIITNEVFTFDDPLSGTYGTTAFMLEIDSSVTTYDIAVGDTVFVDNLWAKEANVKIKQKIYYSLTLENEEGGQLTKHLSTNPQKAYKPAYMLQLGSFSDLYRGWVFYGTSVLFNLANAKPNISWSSKQLGNLDASDNIKIRREYPAFNPGDEITVRYTGYSDDIAFLTINESGTPVRIVFKRLTDNSKEAGWKVSEGNPEIDHYYYAGIEIYRYQTLASADTSKTDFSFAGLMYSIESQ